MFKTSSNDFIFLSTSGRYIFQYYFQQPFLFFFFIVHYYLYAILLVSIKFKWLNFLFFFSFFFVDLRHVYYLQYFHQSIAYFFFYSFSSYFTTTTAISLVSIGLKMAQFLFWSVLGRYTLSNIFSKMFTNLSASILVMCSSHF